MLQKSNCGVPLFNAPFLSIVWEYDHKPYTAEIHIICTTFMPQEYGSNLNHFDIVSAKSYWIRWDSAK